MRPIVLTIAGSDPSGGAGIQADLKAIEANGGYAATAITALTVQNTRGVLDVRPVEPELVGAQVRAVLDDLEVAAVKSGMLGTSATVKVVADLLRARKGRPYVLDPVVAASDGSRLLDDRGVAMLRRELLPLATLLTPNLDDVRALCGVEIGGAVDAERAGRRLLDLGCSAVLVKGGHLRGETASDLLVLPEGARTFSAPRLETRHTHGTGCLLASAIAARLAAGRPLAEAIREAKAFITESIRHGLALGAERGPADPLFAWHEGRDRVADEAGEW